jgi:hypothetical protein
MLAEVLMAAGAVAVAVLATLQWCLSGQALKLEHASQALDLSQTTSFRPNTWALCSRALSSATSTSQISWTFVAMGKTPNRLCRGGQGKHISRRKMAIRYNCKKLSFDRPY